MFYLLLAIFASFVAIIVAAIFSRLSDPHGLLLFRVVLREAVLVRRIRWTRVQIERHQAARLRELLLFASRSSPFYHRLYATSGEVPDGSAKELMPYLASLPSISKDMLMNNFDDVITDRSVKFNDCLNHMKKETYGLLHGKYVVLGTSGTTGRRGIFLYSPVEWVNNVAAMVRVSRFAGIRKNAMTTVRLASVMTRSPYLAGPRVSNSLKFSFMPLSQIDIGDSLENQVAELNAFQPNVIASYPSAFATLIGAACSGQLHIAPKYLIVSGEFMPEQVYQGILATWSGCQIIDVYASTECLPIGSTCQYGKLHLAEDQAIIEIVDNDNRLVPLGQYGSKVLITVLESRTQPLIRYEISDSVCVRNEQCACGSSFRIIEPVRGRVEDVMWFEHRSQVGRFVQVHPFVFLQALASTPSPGWQARQQGARVKVNLLNCLECTPAHCEHVCRAVKDALTRCEAYYEDVSVEVVDELVRGLSGKAPTIAACPDTRRRAQDAAAM